MKNRNKAAQVHVIQLCEVDHDSFWYVKDELIAQCLAEPDRSKKEAMLRAGLVKHAVHSTKEVNVILVVDDPESWDDLRDWYEG